MKYLGVLGGDDWDVTSMPINPSALSHLQVGNFQPLADRCQTENVALDSSGREWKPCVKAEGSRSSGEFPPAGISRLDRSRAILMGRV
jgi:hypothetical protein